MYRLEEAVPLSDCTTIYDVIKAKRIDADNIRFVRVVGIAISMQRGSKQQQLAAVLSIPVFVPITAICSALLYFIGYWQ